MEYRWPSIFVGFVSIDSTNHRWNVFGGKIFPESSKKQNLNLSHTKLKARESNDVWARPAVASVQYRSHANTRPSY